MDEAFVLENVIRYLAYLEERVEMLEKQVRNPQKKSQLVVDDEEWGSSSSTEQQVDAEIQARICDKHVLLRIHCENRKGALVKIIGEAEKLGLDIVNTSVVPLGSLSLNITVLAEKERGFGFTVKELIQSLNAVLSRAV